MSQDFTPAIEHTSSSAALVQPAPEFLPVEESKNETPLLSETFYIQETSLNQKINQLRAHRDEATALVPLAQTYQELAALYWSVGKEEEGNLCKKHADEALSFAEALGIMSAPSPQEEINARIQKMLIADQQKEVLKATMQRISGLITSYETSPRYASHLVDWKAVRELWIRGYEQYREPIVQNNTRCRMVCTLLRLAEKYLSQPKDQLPIERELAGFCSDHAEKYMELILKYGTAARAFFSEYLYIPLCLKEEVLYIAGRVSAIQNSQVLLEEMEVLKKFQQEWSEMLGANRPFEEKHPLLSMLIYVSGRLAQYEVQAMYLEIFVQMPENKLPAITQAEFLLSDAYSHVGKLEQAEEHFDKALNGVLQIGLCYPSLDKLLFQERMEASTKQLETAKAACAVKMQQIAAMQAKEAAVEEEEEDEAELLRKAMALSLEGEGKDAQTTTASTALEEDEKLAFIFQQEENNISIPANQSALLQCYKTLPEKYAKHIAYLEKIEQSEKTPKPYPEQNAVRHQIVCALTDLGELYLSQCAVEFRSSIVRIMCTLVQKAEAAYEAMLKEVLQRDEEVHLHIPLCTGPRIMLLKEKLQILEKGLISQSPSVIILTDAEQLEQLHRLFFQIMALPADEKARTLNRMIYLSGKLEQYAMQAYCLNSLLDMTKTEKTKREIMPYKMQSLLLLSKAYYHLGELNEAKEYFYQLREWLGVMGLMSFSYGPFVFEEFERYAPQLAQAMEEAAQKVKDKEEEEDEETLLRKVMELSLEGQEESAEEEEEEEEEVVPIPASPIAPGALQNMFALFGATLGAAVRTHRENWEEKNALAIEESRAMALARNNVGPEAIPDWELENVPKDGNCFYTASALELEKNEMGRVFLAGAPEGGLYSEYLRQHIQGKGCKDEEWADIGEIEKFVCDPVLQVVVAVIDTRAPQAGFVYYYKDPVTGVGTHSKHREKVPLEGKILVRLAFTGNHYLSVRYTSEENHALLKAPGRPR